MIVLILGILGFPSVPNSLRSACRLCPHAIDGSTLMFARSAIIFLPFAAMATALAAADDPDFDVVQAWIAQDSPSPKWNACPDGAYSQGSPTLGRNPSEARNPYFGFATGVKTPTFKCFQSGPFAHGGEQWWVQVVSDVKGTGPFAGKYVDTVRACSPTRVVPPAAAAGKPGPCISEQGTGPMGCEVCARTVRAPDS